MILVIFEQLKIENQTYNEKIEERNEVSRPIIPTTIGIAEVEEKNYKRCSSFDTRQGKIAIYASRNDSIEIRIEEPR